jgi:hypothetical protein
MTGSADEMAFLQWLETISLPQVENSFRSLDSLDGLLLAGLVEHEEIRSMSAWEAALRDLWNATFNAHRAQELQRQAFFHRGRAVPSLYPDPGTRRRLYRTGLPPSTAMELLAVIDDIQRSLSTGRPYGGWTDEQRIAYVIQMVEAIGSVSRFRPEAEPAAWQEQLRWWLQAPHAPRPADHDIAAWHKNVSQWFMYRFCWGLGGVIGVSFDDLHGGQLLETSLDQWEQTGLPWIVFWLKELISWGVLDPVAALLLGRGLARSRSEASSAAADYYRSPFAQNPADPLAPRAIRDWAEAMFPATVPARGALQSGRIAVEITDDAVASLDRTLRVFPIREVAGVAWMDAAGFVVARTRNMQWTWTDDDLEAIDFSLAPGERTVSLAAYL